MAPVPALERLRDRGHWGIKRGLENIRALLSRLHHPERGCPVVLIGGTNGKGSTGAFLAHALRAGGRRVGWTTSPHLLHPRERVWIDGAAISSVELEDALEAAFDAEEALGLQATYFELVIAAAFHAFREQAVELAVVEVGMGGRWDATNASDPVLSVITSVGLDHQQYLGDTREAIAREKLCIARDGRPLVLGPSLAPDWIAPLLECTPMLHPAPRVASEEVAWDHSVVEGRRIGLAGRHQLENLATAREALRRLASLGLGVEPDRAAEGYALARIPGRLWAVPGLKDVWMDGAHNPHGAAALADHALACGVRPRLLVGAMGDKDLRGVAGELSRTDPRSVTFVRGTDRRYATFDDLREAWGRPEAEGLDPAAAAARMRASREGLLLVTGSLYLLGDLLAELGLDPAS